MNRGVPVKNKVLTKKWAENVQRIHMLKLKNMHARVNSGRPAEFYHLKIKAKREQMLEDRFTEIERENRILLEKMSSIMNKRQNKDLGNEVKSLNTNARKVELRRITIENQAMLKRLQEKSPCYNTHQWEEDRKRTEKRLKDICEFPYIGFRGKSTPVHLKKPRKLSPVDKSTVFKKGVAINDKHFVVEITKGRNFLMIYLNDVESPDSYSLKIPNNEALELMGSHYNYERLVNMLDMENGEIILVDPRDNYGYESAPIQDSKFKTSGTAGFWNKPKTKEEKMIRSLDFEANIKKKNKDLKDQGGKDMSKTGYDGFYINTKRESENGTERLLKDEIKKRQDFEDKYQDEYEEDQDEYEEEEDENEVSNEKAVDGNKNVVEEEEDDDDDYGFEDNGENAGNNARVYEEDEENEDKNSFDNESVDKSVTLLEDFDTRIA